MDSRIKIYSYPNGEIQRVQLVRLPGWDALDFLTLPYAPESLDRFANVYRNYLVPACPWLFGNMVLFHIPEDVAVPFSHNTEKYGAVSQPLTAAAAAIEKGVRFHHGIPSFRDAQTEAFWNTLARRDCIRIVRGKLPITTPIPVGRAPGYLSQVQPHAQMKVNASFFIMDRFDCATVFDHVGTPFGLCVKDGTVLRPPLFSREALLVKKDGTVLVGRPELSDLTVTVSGKVYRHGHNAKIYSRPGYARTPPGKGINLIIIGTEVAGICRDPICPVPASGFVLRVQDASGIVPGDWVHYSGLEDVRFGIQVGNSILKDGIKTEKFLSRFYNIYRFEPIPFPPSLYPRKFRKSRAARIALGADREGNPMLLWAEGAAKLGYRPGEGSRGATLAEMAQFCSDLGMFQAVNLDGGGSAQILLHGRRALEISDRDAATLAEAERPVPLGLIIKNQNHH